MATKKGAAKGTAVTKWDEELARQANIAAGIEDSVNTGGNYIGTRGGQLVFNDNEIPGNRMNVIVLDHVLENALYEGKFDPDNPASPICFALGTKDADMVPHEKSPTPQHEKCVGCEFNEFASADTGRGKACKNIRRLALITEDALEDIEMAQVAFIKVPVTSVRNWAAYVKKLKEQMNRPPLGVVTEISLIPDKKTQFKMFFKLVDPVVDDHIGALLEKQKEVKEPLMAPYTPFEKDDEGPKRESRNAKLKGRPVIKGGSGGKKASGRGARA